MNNEINNEIKIIKSTLTVSEFEDELKSFGIDVVRKHPKCKGRYDPFDIYSDCGYNTTLTCDECKYGFGKKDPEAKCNSNQG